MVRLALLVFTALLAAGLTLGAIHEPLWAGLETQQAAAAQPLR